MRILIRCKPVQVLKRRACMVDLVKVHLRHIAGMQVHQIGFIAQRLRDVGIVLVEVLHRRNRTVAPVRLKNAISLMSSGIHCTHADIARTQHQLVESARYTSGPLLPARFRAGCSSARPGRRKSSSVHSPHRDSSTRQRALCSCPKSTTTVSFFCSGRQYDSAPVCCPG